MTSDGLFSAVEPTGRSLAGYRLHHLEMLNWGTFDARVWRLDLGAQTGLLTGDIGSGKSTLVDAITTLLMPAHRIAYNKAAGAEARERTLRSYVEGHYKSERVEATGRSRARGLREVRRTYSVVLAVFVNEGYDETVSLAQVFQQRDTTGQPYRFYVTAAKQLSIAADFADFGSDLRDLRKRLRASDAEVFDEFPKYAASLRRLLGIRSDQALELFHQTVSMKSVGNLNDFVRDNMLEPSDATERVRDIMDHFDDLTKAHDAVKRAREQLEALEPIVATAGKYDASLDERGQLERDRAAVRLFVAELSAGLLGAEIASLEDDRARLARDQDELEAKQRELTADRESLIEERARAGGDRIGALERLAADARAQADTRRRARATFDAALDQAGMEPITSAAAFADLTHRVAREGSQLHHRKRSLDASVAATIGRESDVTRRAAATADELANLEQRTTNLPVEQVEVRAQLCHDLGLSADDLPYAGEMLDVRDEHAEWRGAAERVLRGFALSLLVPQSHYEAVARWVNGRRLSVTGRGGRIVGARLVYERVAERRVPLQRPDDGVLLLADCLEVKEGPFADYLRDELLRRADHRCAWTLDQLRAERRAVTREGQVRSGDRHEKDDRHRVDDPRRWVLGWANERKIAALRDDLADLDTERTTITAALGVLTDEREDVQRRQIAHGQLGTFHAWTDLDVAEAETRAAAHDDERARLESGTSRLSEIAEALERNEQRAGEMSRLVAAAIGELATTDRQLERSRRELTKANDFITACTPDELEIARTSYPALEQRVEGTLPVSADDCAELERDLVRQVSERIDLLTAQMNGHALNLTKLMGGFLGRWPELRADLDESLEARTEFRARRDRVATDDLPRFEAEFKVQLNQKTIQELASFANWLNRQTSAIDERVARINEALGAVPYNPGRYICLVKEPTSNQDITAFRTDLRNLTNDSLVVDGDQYSEQRFLDVKRIIDRFRGREGFADADRAWTRRVTDVRNWFVFSASERDHDTHVEWEHYSDSDGKSGGQKEKLAYTILAASLAYQFGLEWGAAMSKDFRFAVIDEAFGRGSDVSTRYALELFAKLGLQLLIVTPLQKVHVIEPYVKAIGFVDNPTGTESRLHTMTIEEYRERRAAREG